MGVASCSSEAAETDAVFRGRMCEGSGWGRLRRRRGGVLAAGPRSLPVRPTAQGRRSLPVRPRIPGPTPSPPGLRPQSPGLPFPGPRLSPCLAPESPAKVLVSGSPRPQPLGPRPGVPLPPRPAPGPESPVPPCPAPGPQPQTQVPGSRAPTRSLPPQVRSWSPAPALGPGPSLSPCPVPCHSRGGAGPTAPWPLGSLTSVLSQLCLPVQYIKQQHCRHGHFLPFNWVCEDRDIKPWTC